MTVLWHRNNVDIFPSEGNSSTITITDAKDGDNVSCRAKNSMGSDVATSIIHVQGDNNYNTNTES